METGQILWVATYPPYLQTSFSFLFSFFFFLFFFQNFNFHALRFFSAGSTVSPELQCKCTSRGSSIRLRSSVRPSINSGFSETATCTQAKFYGKLPNRHISRPFIFFFPQFSNFKFLRFYLSFSLPQLLPDIPTKLYERNISHGGI